MRNPYPRVADPERPRHYGLSGDSGKPGHDVFLPSSTQAPKARAGNTSLIAFRKGICSDKRGSGSPAKFLSPYSSLCNNESFYAH